MRKTTVLLRDMDVTQCDQSWGAPRIDRWSKDKPFQIGGRVFVHGVSLGADSTLTVRLNRNVNRLRGWIGVDDAAESKVPIRFFVRGDNKEIWSSGWRAPGAAPLPIDIDVARIQVLQLGTESNNQEGREGADWGEAMFEGCTETPVAIVQPTENKRFWTPGRRWFDTNGKPIQAHGGGILRHNGRWYWFGEDRSNGYVGIGVSGYVSDNLKTWKHLGVVLPKSAYDQKHGENTICERPKVIYNPRTKQFVLWFHYDRSGYGDSQAGVAVADRIEGPYRFLGMHRPIEKSTFRDMNVFVDDNGSAYAYYASEENATMHVVRLNADWTAPEQPMVDGKTWNRILVQKWREAPAPFKHNGKYYLVTSACTGWDANAADIAVADSPLGPYQQLGNPCVGNGANRTFVSQSTAVIPHPNGKSGEFLFLADRWTPNNLADARYIWLPLSFRSSKPEIKWEKQW